MVVIRNPRGSGIAAFLLTWAAGFNLVSNPNEFMTYNGSGGSLTLENNRQLLVPANITISDTDVAITTGSNDTNQILTWRIDGVNTLKTLTIPNGAGTADYTEDTSIDLLRGERVSIIIEGGGLFTASIVSMNSRTVFA